MVEEMASCWDDPVSNNLDYAQIFSRQTKQSYATCFIFITLILSLLAHLKQIVIDFYIWCQCKGITIYIATEVNLQHKICFNSQNVFYKKIFIMTFFYF